jgi:hypothetical protein
MIRKSRPSIGDPSHTFVDCQPIYVGRPAKQFLRGGSSAP